MCLFWQIISYKLITTSGYCQVNVLQVMQRHYPGVILPALPKRGGGMRFSLLFVLALLISGCQPSPEQRVLRISGATMGTTYSIAWVGQDATLSESLQAAAEQRLHDINSSMSTYDPGSELSLLNQNRTEQDEYGWIPVSSGLAEVLAMSLDIWEASGGAFDVTIGPLVNLWGFGPEARPEHAPDTATIRTMLAAVGSDAIELDAAALRLRLAKPVYIDLSAIAKGWAVDQLALLLEEHGISAYMVEIGGEIRTRGVKPDGNRWRIAIERPQAAVTDRQVALIIEPGSYGLATSGDYRNYFEENGVRFSHTIDPLTGTPVSHKLASVSVVHESTGMADGWATAISVLGPDKGLAIAEQQQLAVFMLVREGDQFVQRTSSRFNQLFPHVAD